jgi:hypothetical protein
VQHFHTKYLKRPETPLRPVFINRARGIAELLPKAWDV